MTTRCVFFVMGGFLLSKISGLGRKNFNCTRDIGESGQNEWFVVFYCRMDGCCQEITIAPIHTCGSLYVQYVLQVVAGVVAQS